MHLARISAARWEQFALAAIVIGVVIRAAWVLALHPPLDHVYSDMDGYVGDPRYRSLYDVFALAVAAGILSYLFVERPVEETTAKTAG